MREDRTIADLCSNFESNVRQFAMTSLLYCYRKNWLFLVLGLVNEPISIATRKPLTFLHTWCIRLRNMDIAVVSNSARDSCGANKKVNGLGPIIDGKLERIHVAGIEVMINMADWNDHQYG